MIQYNLDSVSNFRFFGFATGSYSCKCAECGIGFIGDKRASQCLGCAIKHAQKTTPDRDYAKCNQCKDYYSDMSTGINFCPHCGGELKKHFA